MTTARLAPTILAMAVALGTPTAVADVGDPQVRTDHPYYPGELACSTFERLFATQADLFRLKTGRLPVTDEDKSLASWLWRTTHYYHGEDGAEDFSGAGFGRGLEPKGREYWTGLFAHGFGLCGSTHAQWSAEFEARLGHGRSRVVGVSGHNSFEVFLTGGAYGTGRWALLDHDVATIVFDDQGRSLLAVADLTRNLKRLTDRTYRPEKQAGWPVCGLHPADGSAFDQFGQVEYLAGYAGPPPMLRLRRGETLRRYLEPGLVDGQTFVFWGRNAQAGAIPGPERSLTWVNDPESLLGDATGGVTHQPGRARYGNAVSTYRPDFAGTGYRDGVVAEGDDFVVFEFETPYIIGSTPADDTPWGVYAPGGRNGLVLRGRANVPVTVSTDRGQTWQDAGTFRDGLDLTDLVKGRRQYRLRLGAGAAALRGSGLVIRTVCQANAAILPRLKDGKTQVTFQASGRAVSLAGPNVDQARAALVEGDFNTPRLTLALAAPRGEPIVALHASAHVQSSNPPDPAVTYRIERSVDAGASWQPLVDGWRIERRGVEPADFWSQSFCWGEQAVEIAEGSPPPRVRFRNDGGKRYARAELAAVYRTRGREGTRVTFAWTDDSGEHTSTRETPAGSTEPTTWEITTGRGVRTRWVEFEPVATVPPTP